MDVFNSRDDDGRFSCGLLLRQGVFQDGPPENLRRWTFRPVPLRRRQSVIAIANSAMVSVKLVKNTSDGVCTIKGGQGNEDLLSLIEQ